MDSSRQEPLLSFTENQRPASVLQEYLHPTSTLRGTDALGVGPIPLPAGAPPDGRCAEGPGHLEGIHLEEASRALPQLLSHHTTTLFIHLLSLLCFPV